MNPYWDDELIELELGQRVYLSADEPSQIEHKLARASSLQYGTPPRHWQWSE
jgi:hypothetical protein